MPHGSSLSGGADCQAGGATTCYASCKWIHPSASATHTDTMWLDRCGEDADRLFFHGLANGYRPPTSRMVQWIPVQIEGYNGGIEVS